MTRNVCDLARTIMINNGWNWPVESSEHQHGERVPLMREISFEPMSLLEEQSPIGRGTGESALPEP